MKRYILIIICSLSIISSNVYGQGSTLTRDLESWLSVGAEKSFLDKKLTVDLQQQFRLDDNTSRLSQFFTAVGADYEVYKNLKFGLGYRFIRDRNGNDGFVTEHRFNIDAMYSKKINRFKLGGRIRFQKRSNAIYSKYPTTKYRFRLKLKYNIPKWKFDPFASTELYYSKENFMFNGAEDNAISGMQKYRLQIGASRKVWKGDIKLFYMLEHQFSDYGTNFGIPINWNIIGVNYTFKF